MRYSLCFAARSLPTAFLLFALATAPAADESESLGIKAPDGFEVSLYAGDELAHDIYSMTIDSQGRVVVAGAGYVKVLHDDNKDGKADRATLFSDKPASGAHGMVFVGNDLICTGDNSLMKLHDTDGDGVADGQPEVWATLKHSEHGANGVAQGPDGWIYVACGNDAGMTADHATLPTSPVKKPEAGAILRFSPDGKNSEIFAHGFRNIYDLDFNAYGQLFTFDSDGERDHHLPWYAPTRLFDVAEGMHHGWVLQGHTRSWNRPAYFPDVAPRLCEIGRGSPTGVVVYRHTQFPQEYRGNVFSCCWTLGKVYRFNLDIDGCKNTHVVPREFLRTIGETGFAPVDLAVGPEGDMFVAVGGRGTRGSVFRVSLPKGEKKGSDAESEMSDLLNAPQPLSAWSRRKWTPVAKRLGRAALLEAAVDKERREHERVRAVEIFAESFGGPSTVEAGEILRDASGSHLESRIFWSLGRSGMDGDAGALLARHGHCASYWNLVARLETAEEPDSHSILGDWQWKSAIKDISTADRVRMNAIYRADAAREVKVEGRELADLWRLHYRGELTSHNFADAARAFLKAAAPEERLHAIRLMQLALGDINTRQMLADVYAGYTSSADAEVLRTLRSEWGDKLAGQFPSFDTNVNLELSRLLAMLEVNDAALVDRLTDAFVTPGFKELQLHLLIVLSRLPGPRSEAATARTAHGLLHAHPQASTLSRNWPARVGEVTAELFRHDPDLPTTIIESADFGFDWQTLIVNRMPKDLQQAAIRAHLEKIRDQDESDDPIFRWSDELIREFARLPAEESFPKLREAWANIALRDAIVRGLSQSPLPEDREKFLEGLSSVQPSAVQAAAEALTKLGGRGDEKDLAAGFAALRQNCLAIENKSTREALAALLRTWTAEKIAIDEPKEQKELVAAYQPWFDWLEKEHPEVAKKVAGFGDATAGEWLARLKGVDWETGDEERGLVVFQKKACHKCHAGSGPLGPSLVGAAARFSREDLFGSILDPHKEVAPPYQTTQIATSAGKVYSGLIVYESPDGTLVQTTPDTTLRIAGDEILSMKKGRVSLMPSGLLNDASDQDLADLYAYLRTLKNTK